MILGGWGLVGGAIARSIVAEDPTLVVIHSLRRVEAEDAVASLSRRFPNTAARFVPAWGNIFVRTALKDQSREGLLKERETRRTIIDDIMNELTGELLETAYLYQLMTEHQPDIVIDCINTATAFAYQDVYYSVRRVQKVVSQVDAGQAGAEELSDEIENHLTTLSLPQLVRHIQILQESLRAAHTNAYMKIGTTGSGGMGLNIPYTHSEEKPSRVLLSKSSIAGAHSSLLYLLARTPDAPMVKEIKPSAAIAWKQIGVGPVEQGGRFVQLFDCPPDQAATIDRAMSEEPNGWLPVVDESGEQKVLESVYIDTGENGMFSVEEFETVTALGQMEFVTPEEIATDVLVELKGGTTGREVVAALDGATLGPSYRAGVMRHRALDEMRELEKRHQHDSIAFEMLGPPRLSKLLYEGYLLKRVCGTLSTVAENDPEKMSDDATSLVSRDMNLRAGILSIGIPILLPDGRILRGPEMKTPPYKEEARDQIDEAAMNRWADRGWVDLRPANFERWKSRARKILDDVEQQPADDTSSTYYANRAYWRADTDFRVGRVAAWILGVEDGGDRGKAS